MGLSHLSIARAHKDVDLVAVVDSSTYLTSVLGKYAGLKSYPSVEALLANEALDAILIATPSHLHSSMVQAALDKGLHVFCEKPFSLDPDQSERLADLAEQSGLINQVGYHYRFVATFAELQKLVSAGALGTIHGFRVEANGPVVLKPKGSTWRVEAKSGGGCLYDYACHALDLVTYTFGMPEMVGGTVLQKIFSRQVEDAVYSSLFFPSRGIAGQLAANWSDASVRKMTTKLTVWGTNGRASADRQELQVYLRSTAEAAPGYTEGWTTHYVTDLTPEVDFYLRGEEYSAQFDHFIQSIKSGTPALSTFRTAAQTDRLIQMLVADAAAPRSDAAAPQPAPVRRPPGRLRRLLGAT
jgi:predicted dehydrogenase